MMQTVRTELNGKSVILLNGARANQRTGKRIVEVQERDKLLDVARRNPDAVAFGFMSGNWVASA